MLVKFALSDMQLVCDARKGAPRYTKTATRTNFVYDPEPGYIYVRSRAISSRVNENFDGFPAEEIKAAWQTFIGRPVFVNHHNADIKRARGVILDAALHEDRYPDGRPDTWVEVLMMIDAKRFPKLARAIVKGDVDRTSMGTAVAYTICSVCGHQAETPVQYCAHIARMKGLRVIKTVGNKREAVLAYEICHGLNFFENSVLVEDPADPTAGTFGVDTRGVPELAMQASSSVYAFRPMETDTDPITDEQIRTSALRVEAKPRWEDPSQHPWFAQHPVSAQNIMDHYSRATPEDIEQGNRWYPDAHLVAKAIGKGNAAMGAGVLAAYSPQTLWPVNMFNAARAIESGKGIGGPGSGVMATGAMARSADRMIKGEHHSQVLKGPKIQDFAHLIEHGGDQDPSQPHAVIDRHAMSVATGGRLRDDDMEHAPIATRHYYNHVVNAYKDAADQLSQQLGHPVAPHQVQATTWLVRQRENAQQDAAEGGALNKGRGKAMERANQQWNDYAGEHYPSLAGPGYYQAGLKTAAKTALDGTVTDQRAPSQVDTSAPESCPVCRNSGTWNNGRCQVCGYEPPVEPFDAPNTDQAQEVDRQIGQPLDEEQVKPPLYVGQRSHPGSTVGKDHGMPNQQTARQNAAGRNIQLRLDDQDRKIAAINTGQQEIIQLLQGMQQRTAGEMPPQFQKGNDSGSSDSGSSSDSSDSVDKNSDDYKQGYSDGKAGKDKSGSGKNYDAGYSAGKSAASDSSSDSGSGSSDSDDNSKSSTLAERRRKAYLAQKSAMQRTADDNVPTSNEQARQPAATESVDNIGASPAGANTNVTPDATTSLDSSPNTSTLADDNATTIDVENHPASVDDPPSPDAAKDPVDVQAPPPVDNSTSFNTGNGVAWSTKGDPQVRIFTAMRLAKLRITAGVVADKDELVLAQHIADSDMPLPVIQAVAAELNTVIEAARQAQAARTSKQNLVPQPATTTASRQRPSLAAASSNGGIRAHAGLSSPTSDEFGDLP